MTKRALLMVNRHARKGQKSLAMAVDILNDLDFELITVPIKNPQQLAESVRKHGSRVDLVIVGGGDGTLNAVVDSLVEQQLPLGILPLGTANDLARTLAIPLSIPQACKVIAAGHQKSIDLGWVNGKYFFNVASVGLSVNITQKLTRGAKRRWGILAYGFTALQVLSQSHALRAEIRLNNESIAVKTVQIAIGNGSYYGGGMKVAEGATIDDQWLDLYSLELKSWWQIFPLLWRFPQGQHGLLPWVRTLKSREIELYTDKPYDINTDGELTACTPATFRVIPHALSVFVPEFKQEVNLEYN
ncbi:diacylglycerol kinase catalytic region [Gloeothece citriformis PCC 7424]|uniref:Diacylglycerol kinase catalytic region n=1 Tax=Gloeothece citriformis (strain PCC 7424) TaxID=65393 RepID=B7KCV3_GLOC7|nr:lipid kinase [Gloeothece citriformis]ACK71654.1 diacylglycerol kinase catalytic region [Gloeothece citriformis PCC 7424]